MPHYPPFRNIFTCPTILIFLSTLEAQSIQAGPLVWLIPDDAPDELPVARGLPDMDVSPDLKAVREPAYIEYHLYVSPKGETGVFERGVTSPWLRASLNRPDRDFIPAKRDGKSVASEVSLFFIYNPEEANSKGNETIPRLLAVQPPISPVGHKSRRGVQRVVRVHAAIDASGMVTAANALPETDADFGNAAADAVRNWTFAPARKSGQPIAAELEVGVLFLSPPAQQIGKTDTPPKPIKIAQPVYPYGLARAGINGEVNISLIISVEGRVSDPTIISSTHPAFEEAALAAIRQWRFTPALKDGRTVAYSGTQLIAFNLDGKDAQNFSITVPKKFPPDLPEKLRFDVPPHLEHIELPVYPLEDLQAKREGKVTLVYVVGPGGKVEEVTAMPGAPSASLAAAAVAALEKFVFTPPGRQGKPCYAMLRIELEFSIGGNRGHALVTPGTRAALHILEKTPEKLIKAKALDRKPQLRIGKAPQAGPTSSGKGEATIECVLDPDGTPRVPRIVSASEPALGYTAVQTVASWRFVKPRSNGKPAYALVRIPFVFK